MTRGRWFAKPPGPAPERSARRRAGARLGLESLECRTVPSTFDEVESNDTPATANTITPGLGDVLTTASNDWLTINGSAGGASGPDYFRFTLSSRSGVFFDIDSREIGISTTLDSVLTLFDSGGTTQLGSNDDGYDFEGFAAPVNSTGNGTSRDSSLYADLDSGTYFIRVTPFNGSAGAYQLRVLADSNFSTTVPVFNSRPGSADTLYLDFNGHIATDAWGTYDAAAFDFNGNAGVFSPAERLAIRNVWSVVTEDFSPLNINISTVEPGSFANGVGFRQVITNSDPSIVNQTSGILGVAFLDSYVGAGSSDNVAFTFANNFGTYNGGTSGRIMAAALEQGNTTSHELGHALGLEHYATSGGGPVSVIPNAIMATPDTGLNREIWAAGTNEDGMAQVDLDVIGSAMNTFGLAPDDHGPSRETATILSQIGNSFASAGVIQTTLEEDFFRFTASGPTTIRIDVNDYVSNLDVVVRLLDDFGAQLAINDPSNSFDAAITQTLSAGTYYTAVRSNGDVGEVGQYTVRITPAGNQAPTANNLSVATNEDTDVGGTVTGSDPNGDALTYSIVSGPFNGTLLSFNPSTGEFVYRPNPNYFNTAGTPDTFTFRAFDGSLFSNTATVSITVSAVNDAPIVATSGGSTSFVEGGPAVLIDTGVTLTDVDSTTLTGATVQITGGYVNGQDVLAFGGAGGITGSFNPSTGTLTLSGVATVADYVAVLRGVTYVNTSNDPSTITRTVTFIATDGITSSAAATRTITITATNDPPDVVTSGGATAYTENAPSVVIDANLTVTDGDSANLTGATVQITAGYVSGQDVLAFGDTAGVTGSFNAATGTLTLSGVAPVANYMTVLRSVMYVNTSDDPSTITRTVTFTVTDGINFSDGATKTITLSASNDAPVVATSGGSTSFVEGGPAVAIDAGLTVSDFDSAMLTGATVQIVNSAGSQDVLAFTPANGITGSFNAATGTLTLSGVATVADYVAALRSITFANTSDTPNTNFRTILFTVTDGIDSGAATSRTVTVAATNDPAVTALPGSLVASEDTPRTIVGISIADADADAGTVIVTLSVTNGSLTVSTTVVDGLSDGQVSGNGTRSVTLTGTMAAINATLAGGIGLLYVPDANYSGPDVLTATTNDQGNTGGPAQLDTDQVAIDVREVNDAPAAFNDALPGIVEDSGTLSIPLAALTGNDAPGPGEEAGQSLTVVSVGGAFGGTVTLSGEVVLFTPDPNFNGTAGFTYTIRDDGTTGGASDPRTATATVTFAVTPAEDASPAVQQDRASAIGLGPGFPALAALFNADGSLRFVVNAIPGFFGGLSATAGDVNADGRSDLIVGAVFGGFSLVQVFDGSSGGLMRMFFAFPSTGPMASVAANDVNGDGAADIFVGPVFGLPFSGVFSGRDQSFLGFGFAGIFVG